MASPLSSVFLKHCGAVLGTLLAVPCAAVTLSGEVSDGNGAPLADVVVTAMPVSGGAPPPGGGKPVAVTLDQQGREFVPHVLPVRVGTPVLFPNSDDTQHHVYSFSPAKRFEIKLYSGTPSAPVVFDQPGVAALGCNIHDWMLGYVFVTEAPHLTKTDTAGHWALDVPEGEYRLSLWHPDAAVPAALPGATLHAPAGHSLRHAINLKARRQTGKPPGMIQTQGYTDGF